MAVKGYSYLYFHQRHISTGSKNGPTMDMMLLRVEPNHSITSLAPVNR